MSAFEVSHPSGPVAAAVISIRERVNMGNADELEQLARREYDHGMRNLILDLKEMPSITSAGLRVLITLYKLLASGVPAGGQKAAQPRTNTLSPHLKLLSPNPDVYRILDIAGMASRLEIYQDLQSALDSFE